MTPFHGASFFAGGAPCFADSEFKEKNERLENEQKQSYRSCTRLGYSFTVRREKVAGAYLLAVVALNELLVRAWRLTNEVESLASNRWARNTRARGGTVCSNNATPHNKIGVTNKIAEWRFLMRGKSHSEGTRPNVLITSRPRRLPSLLPMTAALAPLRLPGFSGSAC